MNLTIRAAVLSTITNRSPLFSIPSKRDVSFFRIQNSKFSKSFSSIIKGKSSTIYQITHSKFSDILSTAIHLDNENINGTLFKEKQKINSTVTSITHCQFLKCIQHDYYFNSVEGGAILIRGLMVDISDCVIRQCYVSQIGGAIRVSNSASISINNSLIAENNATNFCGGVSLFHVFESVIHNNNLTFNVCKGQVSALMLTRCLESSIENNIFFNNTAKSHAATFLEYTNATGSGLIYVSNNADIATSLVVTHNSDFEVSASYFSDLAKNPSIIVSKRAKVEVKKSFFGGVLKDEIVEESDGEGINDECTEGQKKEIELENLTEISFHVETEEVNRNEFVPIFLGGNEHNTPLSRHTFVEEVDHGLDKSTIMIIAYAIVIMMLIVGLKMYFGGNSTDQKGVSTSIFGDDSDEIEDEPDNFMHDKNDPNKIGEKPELEKLVGKDVPLEEEHEIA